ncbi:MAG: ubiquitin carboxyl-terminal hydrolase, partial [Verrucomicrobiota bacterium]|nr:ubiquitin carboxyl-terminal hydrolase [Verrucomicrobiota bacterium]
MSTITPSVSSPAAPVQQASASCCTILYDLAEGIAQIAIRALYVFAQVFIAAAILPISWHWLALPAVAIGSIVLAGFFFPRFRMLASGAYAGSAVRPLNANTLHPATYPDGSPVGYARLERNCAFNATAHFLDSDPLIAAWMRQKAVPDAIDLPGLIQYLTERQMPAEAIQAFQEYVAAQPPGSSMPELFDRFIRQYQCPATLEAAVRPIANAFRFFQFVLPQFYQQNDEAVAARRALSPGKSETLRASMSAITAAISPNNGEETDAGEICDAILAFAPDELKVHTERTYRFNLQGLPEMLERRLPFQERSALLHLPLNRNIVNGTPLTALMQRFFDDPESESHRYRGVDGVDHNYPVDRVETRFVEPPCALRFQLKRFAFEQPKPSCCPLFSCFASPGGGVKLDTKIECPDEISLTLQDRRVCRYRLASFVTHLGPYERGHYVSGEVRQGRKFLQNDSLVTLVETPEHQALWNDQLQSAYL